MHPNPAFRKETDAHAREFAAARGFGVATAAVEGEVLAAHIPFLLDGDRIEAHLVRSNPLARALARGPVPVPVRILVSGPDGYISPDWYGEDDLVPTWNYIAVHLFGEMRLEEAEELLPHLERLSARFEAALAPKHPWTHHKMREEALAKMMRQILPVSVHVSGVDSTFKLNQNRSEGCRLRAAAGLEAGGTPGQETAALAARMRAV